MPRTVARGRLTARRLREDVTAHTWLEACRIRMEKLAAEEAIEDEKDSQIAVEWEQETGEWEYDPSH